MSMPYAKCKLFSVQKAYTRCKWRVTLKQFQVNIITYMYIHSYRILSLVFGQTCSRKSVDPDQTLQNSSSNQDLYCLPSNHLYTTYNRSYRIYAKYSDRKARGNSVDPDQAPRSVASDQGIHRLPFNLIFQNRL